MKIRNYFTLGIIGILLFTTIAAILLYRSDAFYQNFFMLKTKKNDEVHVLFEQENIKAGQEIRLYSVKTDEGLGQQVAFNISKAMEYAHIHYKEITLDEIKTIPPSPYTGIIICGEDITKLSHNELQQFVQMGGKLITANRFHFDPSWNELLGVTENNGFTVSQGLTFEKTLFPGYPNIPTDSELFTHSVLDVTLNPNTTEVWITAEKIPLLWTNKYGEGHVLYWNTTALNNKVGRGMFVQALGAVFPAFVTAQLGTEIMYIDDFPAPIPDGTVKKVTNLNISTEKFYKQRWWKDMKSIAEQLHIEYTAVAIATYQNKVSPPFEDFSALNRNTYLLFGRELLARNGEIGIHGYNHQPLLLSSDPVDPSLQYVPWATKQDMELGLTTLQKLIYHFYDQEKLETYVPPSNILNETGVQALVDSVPTLETIASLYTGSPQNGSFIQEFETDNTYKHIYHFPRVTSGYSIAKDDLFKLVDVAANFGVISHFIHPDDILDADRSGNLTWNELFQDYQSLIKNIRTWYPHIRSTTQNEATAAIKQYQEGDLIVRYEENAVHIAYKNLPEGASAILRVQEGKTVKTGTFSYGTIKKLGSQLYSVQLKKPKATIQIKEV
ncbi:DUF2194 domain-containing protein [Bacillus manliponensis]|uniref:DUF2194 domain-containing protein n=1 Tax=Bacillus manliponensis TaxID=574376 RepID=UPI00351215AB